MRNPLTSAGKPGQGSDDQRLDAGVSKVGCRTGAKVAEWLTGMSWLTRPASFALR